MSGPIDALVVELNDQLIEASCWMQTFEQLENPPPWGFPVARLLERIDAKAQALQELLNAPEVPA